MPRTTSPLTTLWNAHRPLTALAVAMVPLIVVCVIGLVVDDRLIVGAPAWAKPLKFAVSFLVYGAMWAWLMSYQRKYKRISWWLGTVIATAAAIETIVITAQVLRGQASHYNNLTDFDALMFSIMGGTIMILFIANMAWAILLWRQDLGDRSLTWAIRSGTAISTLGLALATLMIIPSPEQTANLEADIPTMVGAHSVGVPDGGAGLPLLDWSTEGGDLRIPHFVGMHALQLLPLFAAALLFAASRHPALRSTLVRTRLVHTFAFGYLGLVGLVTWQALRGQPLLSPDTATLGAAAALTLAVTAATAVILRKAPSATAAQVSTEAEPATVGSAQR